MHDHDAARTAVLNHLRARQDELRTELKQCEGGTMPGWGAPAGAIPRHIVEAMTGARVAMIKGELAGLQSAIDHVSAEPGVRQT